MDIHHTGNVTPITAAIPEDILKEPIITDSYVVLATDALQHQDMLDYLKESDKGFVEVEGGYLMTQQECGSSDTYVTERAVIVSLATAGELGRLGYLDSQESVLHLFNKDSRNCYKAELIFIDGTESKDLGWLRQVSEEVALANPDGYTFRPHEAGNFDTGDGSYFTTTLDIKEEGVT